MQCDKIQEQLSAYLDDALSPSEKGIIDEHLRSCPKCRESLADLEMTVSSIKGLDEIIPPPWLTQKVMTRVKAEAESKNRSLLQKFFYPLHIKLPIEAVGIFLVAITALYVFKSMEPEFNTVIAPSEEKVSEYTAKRKNSEPKTKTKKQIQPPAVTLSKKDKTTSGSPSLQESGQRPASPSEQSIYDQRSSVKEKSSEELKAFEKNIPMKSAPSPAEQPATDRLLLRPSEKQHTSPSPSSPPLKGGEIFQPSPSRGEGKGEGALLMNPPVKQERAPQPASKIISGITEKEDISLSLKARDTDSAKRELEEVFSDLGGKVLREELTSGTLIIIGELGSDKLLPFMQKLKTLGYVKENTPTPMSDKEQVLIKITVSRH